MDLLSWTPKPRPAREPVQLGLFGIEFVSELEK
jgi:hypothetical protein